MPELHGRADDFRGGLVLVVVLRVLVRFRRHQWCGGAPDVVPDAGHDVLGPDVRLVEHAEPEPVRERPPELSVVLTGGRHCGHADSPGRRV